MVWKNHNFTSCCYVIILKCGNELRKALKRKCKEFVAMSIRRLQLLVRNLSMSVAVIVTNYEKHTYLRRTPEITTNESPPMRWADASCVHRVNTLRAVTQDDRWRENGQRSDKKKWTATAHDKVNYCRILLIDDFSIWHSFPLNCACPSEHVSAWAPAQLDLSYFTLISFVAHTTVRANTFENMSDFYKSHSHTLH